jgi:hypothetical protein
VSLVPAQLALALDEGLTGVTHVCWSEDGATISAKLDPTAITLTAATAANPSVVMNDAAVESSEATLGCTITHFAFSADTALFTTWNALYEPVILLASGKLLVKANVLREYLHQATSAPA